MIRTKRILFRWFCQKEIKTGQTNDFFFSMYGMGSEERVTLLPINLSILYKYNSLFLYRQDGRLLQIIHRQLKAYFAGGLKIFSVFIVPEGTPFPKRTGNILVKFRTSVTSD